VSSDVKNSSLYFNEFANIKLNSINFSIIVRKLTGNPAVINNFEEGKSVVLSTLEKMGITAANSNVEFVFDKLKFRDVEITLDKNHATFELSGIRSDTSDTLIHRPITDISKVLFDCAILTPWIGPSKINRLLFYSYKYNYAKIDPKLMIDDLLPDNTSVMKDYPEISNKIIKLELLNKITNDDIKPFNTDILMYTPNLEELIFSGLNDGKKLNTEIFTRLTKLKYIEFPNFNDDISNLKNCNELTTLIFYTPFNKPIDVLANCPKLKILDLGKQFNQDISALAMCPKLEGLALGDKFNQEISALARCPKLTNLEFGEDFNQDISALENCTELKSLQFGEQFNQDISALARCTKLTSLKFGEQFNQDISALARCPKLTSLKFGEQFNQDISALENCTELKSLEFGRLAMIF
jgi:hypothetical protein